MPIISRINMSVKMAPINNCIFIYSFDEIRYIVVSLTCPLTSCCNS